MTETNFCLRVDIDTWSGLKQGLLTCIDLSHRHAIPITYYLSLGKYATGQNIFYLFKKQENILKRSLKPWQRNHWSDLLRGVLYPSARIRKKTSKFLRQIYRDSIVDLHPHGYNHVSWAHNFADFNSAKTHTYLDYMISEYNQIFGEKPIANACPNFTSNNYYLSYLKEKGFKFASDFQYSHPFIPIYERESEIYHSVVQLPVTEPTIEDLLLRGKSGADILSFFEQRFRHCTDRELPYLCLYMHAVFEPLRLSKVLEGIVDLAFRYDLKLVTHGQFYKENNDFPSINLDEIQNYVITYD